MGENRIRETLVSLHFHGYKIVCGYIFLPLETRPPMGSSRNSRNSRSRSSIPSACYVFMLDYTITIWASIHRALSHKCATRIYVYIYIRDIRIYSTVNVTDDKSISRLSAWWNREAALRGEKYLGGQRNRRKEKKKERNKERKKEKKERREGKVRISIYRGIGGLLNFIWSEWSRFSLSRCYGLSMQVRLVIFMAFGLGYLQTARVQIPFNPDKSFSCPEIAL